MVEKEEEIWRERKRSGRMEREGGKVERIVDGEEMRQKNKKWTNKRDIERGADESGKEKDKLKRRKGERK